MRLSLYSLEVNNLTSFAGVTSEIQCFLFQKCIFISVFFLVQNVVEGEVHQEGVEPPAVRQVEEEAFNEAVPGAQVEEQGAVLEAVLEAGGVAVDLEVVTVAAVEVVAGVDLVAVGDVEVEVSEGHSSGGSKNLFLYRNSFTLYFFSVYLTTNRMEKHKVR